MPKFITEFNLNKNKCDFSLVTDALVEFMNLPIYVKQLNFDLMPNAGKNAKKPLKMAHFKSIYSGV